MAFPPLEFKEAGSDEPTGFDIEAAQAVASTWGVETEIVDMGFDGLLPALDAKRCDAVWSGMFLNDERQQKADASPYLKTGNGLLVAKGNPAGIMSADDLAGKRLAVAAGTTAVDVANKLSDDLVAKGLDAIEIQSYPTFPAEVGAVKSGKADAVLEVDVALADAVRTAPDMFELVPSAFPSDGDLAVYSAKDSGIAAAITQAWEGLIADGTAAALAQKYGVPVENLTAG
ncbi:MAG: ABC transporter substrate-binding protein [Candidatus Nanopelagicales bacterium]